MGIELRFDTKDVDWVEAADVFERAPLGTREPDKLRRTFENSQIVCFAWDKGHVIGMARVLSDRVTQSVIYDLCMLPEYQGAGLGKRMMNAIMKRIETPNVVLYAVPGKEGFYKKFGFRVMTTAMASFADPHSMLEKGYIK